jgi:hypothetical protein
MHIVPDEFRARPFHRGEGLAAGITRSVLQGPQFVRIHESVYRHRDHEMSFDDDVEAARLAMPGSARTTSLTRIRQAGLAYGDRSLLHFVVQGDHHLAVPGIFLHRTVLMPPCDDVGVTVTAAFVAYCSEGRVLDVIKVGSILMHRDQLDLAELEAMFREQRWRRGCREAEWVLPYLDGRCRSLPEAELFALIMWSGLPLPEINEPLDIGGGEVLTPDFWWSPWQRIAEYEGSQHQEDREQYVTDIDRYAAFRRLGAGYVQITKETMRTPRIAIGRIFSALVEGGYDGPVPTFGEQWRMLFRPLSDVVREQARDVG